MPRPLRYDGDRVNENHTRWTECRSFDVGLDTAEAAEQIMQKGRDPGSDRFHERERKKKMHEDRLPGEDDEPLPPPVEPIKGGEKPGRNDPCSCGSGKKYKQCCGRAG